MTENGAWYRRLTTQVLFFLTLAMVPLGIIGVLQNDRLADEIQQRSELSLLALTEAAASGERQIIQRAFGAADALNGLPEAFRRDAESCRAFVNRLKQFNENFAFVGFIEISGISQCSTAETTLDFSGYPSFPDLIANPRQNVEVNLQAPGSGQSVMIINQPSYAGDRFNGYVSISLPLRDVGQTDDFMGDADPLTLITFNDAGELLSTEESRERTKGLLPRDVALASLTSGEALTFVAPNEAGESHVYAVTPIVPDTVYALGVWPLDRLAGQSQVSAIADAFLPFLMWFASLLVVWFIIDRLVIDRVKQLNGAIQRFAQDRTVPSLPSKASTTELGALEQAFNGMAQGILYDEATQEAQLREKAVLLKEVHHRVKNNLQIISSIMNMQIRKADADETKTALRQVQDRIMGLSGVHRSLYQAENLTQVNAASLIEQIVEQSRAIGDLARDPVDVDLSLTPVIVFPDQAVPLSMLVSEALTNAMKYIGGENPRLAVSLSITDGDQAELVIENSRGGMAAAEAAVDPTSTGLGQQLIRAFTTQLNGTADVTETEETYRLSVAFEIESFTEEPRDY